MIKKTKPEGGGITGKVLKVGEGKDSILLHCIVYMYKTFREMERNFFKKKIKDHSGPYSQSAE